MRFVEYVFKPCKRGGAIPYCIRRRGGILADPLAFLSGKRNAARRLRFRSRLVDAA